MANDILMEQPQDELATAVAHSQQSWRRLGMRIRSITPSVLARFGLMLGTVGWLAWLIT
jgi:hypothetical protein